MTPFTLVSGGNYEQRESAIAAAIQNLPSPLVCAVFLEGLPTGKLILNASNMLQIHRIAPACPCCIGNLAMRVTLHRILKKSPKRLFIAIDNEQHLDSILQFLESVPYNDLLRFDQQIQCE